MGIRYNDWREFFYNPDEIPQTPGNFPACKSFYQMNEDLIDDRNIINDVITGAESLVQRTSNFFLHGANNTILQDNGPGKPSTDIAIGDINTGYIVSVFAGDLSLGSNHISFGDYAAGANPYSGVELSGGAARGTSGVFAGNQYLVSATVPVTLGGFVVAHEVAVGAPTDGKFAASNGVTSSIVTLSAQAAACPALDFSNNDLDEMIHFVTCPTASMGLFHLPFMPSDSELLAIAEWVNESHINKNKKVICPFFIGLEST